MEKHRGEETRRQILTAAETIFANLGFDSARLEDVALAVGIRRPSILYYFPNKQHLYDAVEADIFAALHRFSVERTAGLADPRERLLGLLDAWLDFHVARPTAARIIQRLVADATPRSGNPVEYSHVSLGDLEAVIAEGVARGVFRSIPIHHVVNAVTSGALFHVCNGGQLGPDRGYDPADPGEVAAFRQLIHRLALAAVTP